MAVAGDYRVDLVPTNRQQKPSNYKIEVVEIRGLVPDDPKTNSARTAIILTFSAANKLDLTQTEPSAREAIEKYREIIELARITNDKYLEGQMLVRIVFIQRLTE